MYHCATPQSDEICSTREGEPPFLSGAMQTTWSCTFVSCTCMFHPHVCARLNTIANRRGVPCDVEFCNPDAAWAPHHTTPYQQPGMSTHTHKYMHTPAPLALRGQLHASSQPAAVCAPAPSPLGPGRRRLLGAPLRLTPTLLLKYCPQWCSCRRSRHSPRTSVVPRAQVCVSAQQPHYLWL